MDVEYLGPLDRRTNYDEEVKLAALKVGLDPDFAVAVHRNEYNPDKWVSKAGARGPMQLMPETASKLGVNPDDPIQNIEGGVRYLKDQFDTFGTPELASAAYNAGPEAVMKHRGIPPFAETLNFVPNVMKQYASSKKSDKPVYLGPLEDEEIEYLGPLEEEAQPEIPPEKRQGIIAPIPKPDDPFYLERGIRKLKEIIGTGEAEASDPIDLSGERPMVPPPRPSSSTISHIIPGATVEEGQLRVNPMEWLQAQADRQVKTPEELEYTMVTLPPPSVTARPEPETPVESAPVVRPEIPATRVGPSEVPVPEPVPEEQDGGIETTPGYVEPGLVPSPEDMAEPKSPAEILQGLLDAAERLTTPTEPATSATDMLGRVIPESAKKAAFQMNPLVVTYNMIKPFTDKVIEIAQRTPEELVKSSFIKDTLDPLMANLSGFSEFVGEPIGVYGIQKAKERWLSDPIGSTVALASVVFPAFKQAKSKAVEGIRHSARDVVGTFSPASLGTEARTTAETGRKHLSEMARKGDRAEFALRKARDHFDAKLPAEGLDFIDRWERGTGQLSQWLQDISSVAARGFNERVAEVRALGTGKLQNLILNYFPHIWKDPAKAGQFLQEWLSRRPMQGKGAFLKQRSIPTIKDGMSWRVYDSQGNLVGLHADRLGAERQAATVRNSRIGEPLEPVSTNPVDMILLKYREMDKYIMAHRWIQELKRNGIAVFVKSGHKPPPGYVPINDKIAKVFVSTEKYGKYVYEESVRENISSVRNVINEIVTEEGGGGLTPGNQRVEQRVMEALQSRGWTEAESRQMIERVQRQPSPESKQRIIEREVEKIVARDITKIIQHGFVPGKGFVNVGNYYAVESAARIINNYLSPGLRGKPLFRAYLGVGNLLNQAQLGLSGFHLGFTTLDAIMSKFALGVHQIAHGHPVKGAGNIIGTLASPVTNIYRGSKLYKEWFSPGTQGAEMAAMVDRLQTAGGRARMDSFYRTEITRNFMKAVKDFTNPATPAGSRAEAAFRAAFRIPGVLIEQSMRPVLEYVVPRQKLGVFMDLARVEMERLQGQPNSVIRTALTKMWDSVDNRMGQLVYDNLFWNKTLKDLGMASVRSLGWNLGTFRELGGAGIDTAKFLKDVSMGRKPDFTYRMSYAVSLPIVVGTLGAVTQYLYTGKGPTEMKDYFFPKTGKLDDAGRPERVSLPSYMKDLYHWYHAPGRTAKNKLHPMLNIMAEILDNKDFYGVQIRNPDDPINKRAIDILTHLGKSVLPFSVRGYLKEEERGAEGISKAMPFIGIVPAPADVNKTPFELKLGELVHARMPSEAMTKEQKEKQDLKREITKDVRAGRPAKPETLDKLDKLNKKELKGAVKKGMATPLEALAEAVPIEQLLDSMGLAAPEERKLLAPIIIKKYIKKMGDATHEDRERLSKKFKMEMDKINKK